MKVIADNEQGSLFRDVFQPLYLPFSEREYQNVYHDSAEVIDPVHLVTIISRREKTKQT
jgi:hypothetical protein